MDTFVCTTCGTQYAESIEPPEHCPICEDERQFVNWNGQEWTTLAQLQRSHHNVLRAQGEHIKGIGSEPKFAIGQRALWVQTGEGNLLWDCISLIDEATVEAVRPLGGNLRHRYFPSALLQLAGRLESAVRERADLPPCCRPGMGHAA